MGKRDAETVKKLTARVEEATASLPAEKQKEEAPQGALAKMKAFVRKAVDCCIE